MNSPSNGNCWCDYYTCLRVQSPICVDSIRLPRKNKNVHHKNDSTRKQTSQWNNQGNFSVFYIHTGLTMKVSPRPPRLHRDHTATPPEGCLGHGLLLFHLGPGCLDGVIGAKTGPICCLTPHVACIVLFCFIYLPFSVIQPFEM